MKTPDSIDLGYLRNTDIFRGLSDDALMSIYARAQFRTYGKNEMIFFQGSPASRFYIVKSGQLKLYQITEDGERIALRYLNAGDAFGVIVVLRRAEYPVSAETTSRCELIGWSDEIITHIMSEYPRVAINAISILSDFILDFMDRIQGLSTRKVDQRVARALLRFAEMTQSRPLPGGGFRIGLRLTRQDIAEITGTTLFTVSRTLSEWEKDGVIDTTTARITILSPEGLRQIADGNPLPEREES